MTVESRDGPIRQGPLGDGPTFAGKKLNRHRLQVSNSIQTVLFPEIMMPLACCAGRVAQSLDINWSLGHGHIFNGTWRDSSMRRFRLLIRD
jgi:hypothetical protein